MSRQFDRQVNTLLEGLGALAVSAIVLGVVQLNERNKTSPEDKLLNLYPSAGNWGNHQPLSTCPSCSAQIAATLVWCPECGEDTLPEEATSIETPPPEPPKKSISPLGCFLLMLIVPSLYCVAVAGSTGDPAQVIISLAILGVPVLAFMRFGFKQNQ